VDRELRKNTVAMDRRRACAWHARAWNIYGGKARKGESMSFDRIWMCPSLKRDEWVEVITKSRGLKSDNEVFTDEQIEAELQKYGKFQVSLWMGNRCAMDEVYVFLNESDARRFFAGEPIDAGEHGYKNRERFEDDAGIGFDKVELWINGELVATKENE
jgi:hypothetical protein